jgi:hypothetical protein
MVLSPVLPSSSGGSGQQGGPDSLPADGDSGSGIAEDWGADKGSRSYQGLLMMSFMKGSADFASECSGSPESLQLDHK